MCGCAMINRSCRGAVSPSRHGGPDLPIYYLPGRARAFILGPPARPRGAILDAAAAASCPRDLCGLAGRSTQKRPPWHARGLCARLGMGRESVLSRLLQSRCSLQLEAALEEVRPARAPRAPKTRPPRRRSRRRRTTSRIASRRARPATAAGSPTRTTPKP